MKKKSIASKLYLNKSIVSKFNAARIKGGGSRRGCVGTNNCGPTSGTDNCTLTGSDVCGTTGTVVACGPNSIGCPIT